MVEVATITITLNEEKNIGKCLESVSGWANEIYVVDSYSDDQTVEIAKEYTDEIHSLEEGHWADIRNWAINELPIESEWVLFLDADEEIPQDLQREITNVIQNSSHDGYYLPRKFIFLGKWLKHGRMHEDVLRLYRRDRISYAESGDVEYAKVDGTVGELSNSMIHDDRKSFSEWIAKHNRISERAVEEEVKKEKGQFDSLIEEDGEVEGGLRHFVREYIWNNIPLWMRPVVFFTYSYFFRLGFLDGSEGFLYHFHHKLWYRFLIYTKYRQEKSKMIDSH